MKATPWKVVFASLVALTVGPTSILFYTQSLFLGPMTQEFGWSRAAYFSAVLAGGVAGAVTTPIAGRLLDRFGVRPVLIAGILLFGLTTASLGLIGGALAGYIGMSALAAIAGVVQGPLSYAKLITGWFDRRRGLALAVALSGTGLGGVFVPPIAAWLIDDYGWRAARFGLGALILLVALPAVLAFVRERGQVSKPTSATAADEAPLEGITLREAARERSYWLLLGAFFLSSLVVNGVLANLVPLLLSRGSVPGIATAALSTLAVGQVAGRLLSGLLLDRVFSARVGMIWYGVGIVGLALIAAAPGPAVILLGTGLIGAALGSELEMASVFTSRFFGRRHFGSINGTMFAAYLFGAAAGPLLASLLVAGNDFGPVITVGAATLALAAVLLLGVARYRYLPEGVTPRMIQMPFVDRVMARAPRAELERRWAAVRARLDELDADALVAFSTEDFLGGYVRWLTDRPAYYGYGTAVVFHRDGLMSLIEHGFMGTRRTVDDRDPDFPGVGEVYQTSAFHSVRFTNGYEAGIVADILRNRGHARVALAGGDAMPKRFVATLEGVAGVTLVDDTDALDLLRAIKGPDEECAIRETALMQDRVFEKVLAMIKPGIHDRDIMAVIQAEGRLEGSEQAVIMVGSAPAGQPPVMRHPRFQNRRIESGDSVTVLIENNGPAGYYTELGRVVTVGRGSNAFRDAVAEMVEAQDASAAKLVPGTPCADIAHAHDAYMEARGRPPETRLYAHGQGYSLVERPLVRADETMAVEKSMTFAVHPAYADASHFAYICDNFWIGPSGAVERLHHTPRQLFEVEG